jgi:two-component system sensor histidine kinase ChiS
MGNVRFYLVMFFVVMTNYSHAQHLIKGQADLSKHNFSSDGSYALSGQWEFYWNTLLTPQDFASDQKPEFLRPGGWNWQSDHPAIGYGTYRIRLILPERQRGLSIYFPVINAAAKVWINGILVLESGIVSTQHDSYQAKLSESIVSIPEQSREIELVIQVANHTYFSGGLGGTPQLDQTSTLFNRMSRLDGVQNFFAGSLIAMFIYQLILYFLFHRGKPYLWLALICLGVALRALIVHGGSFLLPNLFPLVEWEVWKKIEFGSVYAIVAIFPLYVYHLFIDYAPKKPLMFFIGLATGLCFSVLVTPQYIYGKLLEISHVGLLLAFIYAVYSIGRAWRDGNKDARIILAGVLASFPFIVAEILKNSLLYPLNISFMYLVEMGVLVFLLFQVYLLANHYAMAYRNLESLNQNLEKLIEERTTELVTANTVRERLLSVMSHDIKSPLNSLKGVLNIYNKGAINKDEFSQLTLQIENDLSKTSMLVENILHWTANQIKGVQLRPEKFDLFELIEDNLRLFDTLVIKKKISIIHNVPPKREVISDRNILNLVLRNLLSNAIKFSFDGSKITVDVKTGNDLLVMKVIDTGVGMDSETLQTLLSPKNTVSTAGTGNEKGTGLGLSLCRDYVQKAGGTLSVESMVGKGTTFTVTLPLGK